MTQAVMGQTMTTDLTGANGTPSFLVPAILDADLQVCRGWEGSPRLCPVKGTVICVVINLLLLLTICTHTYAAAHMWK